MLLLRLKRFQFWSERISELPQVKESIFLCNILNKAQLFFKQPLMYVFNLRVYSITTINFIHVEKLNSGLCIWILNPIPFFFLFHHSCAAYITSKRKWEIQNIYHRIAFKWQQQASSMKHDRPLIEGLLEIYYYRIGKICQIKSLKNHSPKAT